MGKVHVSEGLLAGLVAVCAAALLAVAFLLGRASGPRAPSAPEPARRALEPLPAPALPEPRPAAGAPAFPAQGPASAADSAAPPPPAATARADPGPRTGPQPDPERGAVASYLQAVDNIQPGKMSGDAEGVASEMAAALAKGDTSGLDGLIRQTEEARRRLAGLAVPAPCQDHHRESLGGLDDALEMLRSLKKAMESPEPAAALAAVTSKAAGVRSRSDALHGMEQALRLRYGLPR